MIHLKSNTFDNPSFPKRLMTHYLPNQANHLAHSKIILYLANLKLGYLFVGSHNLSQPALGKLQKQNSQLYISNYELGIILNINQLKTFEEQDDTSIVNNETLNKQYHLNLPFKIPT